MDGRRRATGAGFGRSRCAARFGPVNGHCRAVARRWCWEGGITSPDFRVDAPCRSRRSPLRKSPPAPTHSPENETGRHGSSRDDPLWMNGTRGWCVASRLLRPSSGWREHRDHSTGGMVGGSPAFHTSGQRPYPTETSAQDNQLPKARRLAAPRNDQNDQTNSESAI